MRTLQSGHTVIRADQFDPDCWQLPEITELCQNSDEGRETNDMSVIAHVCPRPRCMDDDTPTGDHDPESTLSCRPRQKTTSNGDGPTRSHPTNSPTSLPRFESGKQMHGPYQNHKRDVQTSPRLRPSTDCDQEQRQKCDVLQMLRDVWESVVAHSPDHGETEPRDEAEQSHCAFVHREATARHRTRLLSTRTWERRDIVPPKLQGQLKGVDQEACLQLIYESGQRLENQITALALVSRQKVQSGEQVTESFNIPEVFFFFNCVVLDSQPTKSVPRRVRMAIERNIDETCPKRHPQSRLHYENLYVESIGTTRLSRGVACLTRHAS